MPWISSRPGRALLGMLAALGTMIALVFLLRASDWQPALGVRFAVGLAAAAPVIWFGCAYWRSLDEAAREAQMWAWYWGGSGGLAVGCVVLALSAARLGEAFADGRSPAVLMLVGAAAVALAQFLGFLAAWAYWWAKRR